MPLTSKRFLLLGFSAFHVLIQRHTSLSLESLLCMLGKRRKGHRDRDAWSVQKQMKAVNRRPQILDTRRCDDINSRGTAVAPDVGKIETRLRI